MAWDIRGAAPLQLVPVIESLNQIVDNSRDGPTETVPERTNPISKIIRIDRLLTSKFLEVSL